MRLGAQQWQQDFRAQHVAEVAEAESREGILAKIKSASGGKTSKDGPSIIHLKAALTELEVHKPHKAIMPTLFYEDVTPEALAQEIAANWPSSALWSDEAALVVGSHGMSDDSALGYFGLLNRFWDGCKNKGTLVVSFTRRSQDQSARATHNFSFKQSSRSLD
jgi:hypothetical protein